MLTIISAGILLLLNTGQYVLPVKQCIYIVKFDTKSGSSYVLPVKPSNCSSDVVFVCKELHNIMNIYDETCYIHRTWSWQCTYSFTKCCFSFTYLQTKHGHWWWIRLKCTDTLHIKDMFTYIDIRVCHYTEVNLAIQLTIKANAFMGMFNTAKSITLGMLIVFKYGI